MWQPARLSVVTGPDTDDEEADASRGGPVNAARASRPPPQPAQQRQAPALLTPAQVGPVTTDERSGPVLEMNH